MLLPVAAAAATNARSAASWPDDAAEVGPGSGAAAVELTINFVSTASAAAAWPLDRRNATTSRVRLSTESTASSAAASEARAALSFFSRISRCFRPMM
eukprot:CAMPEP_0119292984 /NCGR_PEP_ID=MMETSP1329-20130426/45211_1 /TAXON_ID=114041 /ORGANISM="Genus nov. species nov., Strain RCC1024" /LENGTH=97 /DNA_ID=CAMNT_0007293841 /DNA_START=187 /DNA_END=480 /DNA_ORIENTATION=+